MKDAVSRLIHQALESLAADGQLPADVVPRVQIEGVRVDATVADVVARAVETKYSRLPVYRNDLDDIVGVVHVKSVFAVPAAERATTPVTAIMTDVLAVPEGRDLSDLFRDFRARRMYMAVVVDEHGGTAGIITLEDVIDFYDRGGRANRNLDADIRPLRLAAYEKRALVRFLGTLTGSPDSSQPGSVPSASAGSPMLSSRSK